MFDSIQYFTESRQNRKHIEIGIPLDIVLNVDCLLHFSTTSSSSDSSECNPEKHRCVMRFDYVLVELFCEHLEVKN